MALSQGSIVIAEVVDPQGNNAKERPVIILDDATGETIAVMGITSTLPDPLPEGYIELPWYHDRHSVTGLTRRSAAVIKWATVIDKDSVIRSPGYRCPAAQLGEIIRLLERLDSDETS